MLAMTTRAGAAERSDLSACAIAAGTCNNPGDGEPLTPSHTAATTSSTLEETRS